MRRTARRGATAAVLWLPALLGGCQPPSLIDRYAGDIARYEATGAIADPPLEDELTQELAVSNERLILRRREALLPWEAPRIDGTAAGAAPSGLDSWRLATLARASQGTLQAMREASSVRIEGLREALAATGAPVVEDPLLAELEGAPAGTAGVGLAGRDRVIRLRRAIELEERKLALIDEELFSR